MACSAGPAEGLALLDADDLPGISTYPYVHLVRGTLLRELGRTHEAITELELAEWQARNAHERAQIRAQRKELSRSLHTERSSER